MRRIVCDLDGTLCRTPGMDYAAAVPFPDRIQRLQELAREGCHVTIDTARGSLTGEPWRELTERQLLEWGVPYDDLRVGSKPAATIYVDDRAVNPDALLGPAGHLTIGCRRVGAGHPAYLVAEIGINHQGDPDTAMALVDAAAGAGADAVKFQVGDPERYVSRDRWDRPRETPWGVIPYLEYRRRLELSPDQLARTQLHAIARGLDWFASPLDTSAVALLQDLDPPCYKVASPMLTDHQLLSAVRKTGRPVLLSTGMSTIEEMTRAVAELGPSLGAVLHCTSAYPPPPREINLAMITTLRREFPGVVIGFSDHSVGVPTSVAAVAMGAAVIERHLTLSRAMWGSDHSASLEPAAFATMARYIRTVEASMGDGQKRTYESERENMAKFRRETVGVSIPA